MKSSCFFTLAFSLLSVSLLRAEEPKSCCSVNSRAALMGTPVSTVEVAKRPNIVVFLVDDMGWQDTSVPFLIDENGQPVVTELNQRYRTPAMERLAAQGLRFTRAYAHPVCTPSRVSMVTGMNAARHHVTHWTSVDGKDTSANEKTRLHAPDWRRLGIAEGAITLPAVLAESGYRTIHVGKAHFGAIGTYAQDPRGIGFQVNIAGSEIGHPGSYYGKDNYGEGKPHQVKGLESYHGSETFLTEALTTEAKKAIAVAVEEEVPFFLHLSHYAVHTPFQEDPRFVAHYEGLPKREVAYATLIEGMDESLGEILGELDRLGVAENTLVIFLSDNGGDSPIPNDDVAPTISGNAPLRGRKGTRYEGGLRIPFIVSWAKLSPESSQQQDLPIAPASSQVDLIHVADLFPTVLALAGQPVAHEIDGHDLSPYLRKEEGFTRPQQLITHFPHGGSRNHHFSVYHDGHWKLIYNFVDQSYELYDLSSDLGERENLAGQQPEILTRLARALQAELQEKKALLPINPETGQAEPVVLPNET